MTDERPLLCRDEGRVRVLTLNRPERSNALTPELIGQLCAELSNAEADRDIWAIVVTGVGRSFCAGADLKQMSRADDADTAGDSGSAGGASPRQVRPRITPARNVFELMVSMQTPVLGALNGHAVAGGFELALACDLRVAAAGARLGLPEAKRGMGAAFGSVMLPRLIPPTRAMELLFTGRNLDADEALELGLLNQVVPAEQVLAATLELAAAIVDNAPLTVRRMKATVRGTSGLPLATALALDLGPDPYASADRVEGVRAFVEKRAPRWSNA